MRRKKITVAVTGLNAIDNPGPGVPVIRSLLKSRSLDVRVIGFAYENLEPGIYMPELVDKSYKVPLPSSGITALMERIRQIHKKEKLDVIIPNFDAELINYINLTDPLAKLGIHAFLPTLTQFEERQKFNLPEFGIHHKVKVPKSKPVFIDSEIQSLQEEFSYPFMIKGKFYEAFKVNSPHEAQQYFSRLSSKWGLPVIVQECIKGTEVNVTALGDGKGNMIGAVPMRKQFVTDKGKAWAGISIDDHKLMAITQKIIKETKWRGGLELEMMVSENGEYFLLEINPRFPAWVYLATGCGQNHVEALLKLALGKKVKPFTRYQVGKMFIRYSFDQLVDLKDFEKISTKGEL